MSASSTARGPPRRRGREAPALLLLAALSAASPAAAFDLQGHRGARGLAPENTLAGFAAALAIGVTTLELDVAMTSDGVLVVHHDRRLNPEITRGPDGRFLSGRGPAIHALTLDALRRYDVGRARPGSAYASRFPAQRPSDGARIPALAQVFALVREAGADHVRFNLETKLAPDAADEAPDPERFAGAVAAAVRRAGLGNRVSVQSFDWRTLQILRRIAPDLVRACLTSQRPRFDTIRRGRPGPSPWTAGLDIDAFGGSVPRLVAAAGCGVWSPAFEDLAHGRVAEARALGLKVIPWTVNAAGQMARLIAMGVDGIITDHPERLREVLSARGLPLPPPAGVR